MSKCLCCGCGIDDYGSKEINCVDCFVCPECFHPDPWGESEPSKTCPTCKQLIRGDELKTINLWCRKCKKKWKTDKEFDKRYKERIKAIRAHLKKERSK